MEIETGQMVFLDAGGGDLVGMEDEAFGQLRTLHGHLIRAPASMIHLKGPHKTAKVTVQSSVIMLFEQRV